MPFKALLFCFGRSLTEDILSGPFVPREVNSSDSGASANKHQLVPSCKAKVPTNFVQRDPPRRDEGHSFQYPLSTSYDVKSCAEMPSATLRAVASPPIRAREPPYQRDFMVCARMPAAVTVFNLHGRVVHQNNASISYLGDHIHGRNSLPSVNVLALVFQFDPEKLDRMLRDFEHDSSGRWRGIVRVPQSLLLAAAPESYGAQHRCGSERSAVSPMATPQKTQPDSEAVQQAKVVMRALDGSAQSGSSYRSVQMSIRMDASATAVVHPGASGAASEGAVAAIVAAATASPNLRSLPSVQLQQQPSTKAVAPVEDLPNPAVALEEQNTVPWLAFVRQDGQEPGIKAAGRDVPVAGPQSSPAPAAVAPAPLTLDRDLSDDASKSFAVIPSQERVSLSSATQASGTTATSRGMATGGFLRYLESAHTRCSSRRAVSQDFDPRGVLPFGRGGLPSTATNPIAMSAPRPPLASQWAAPAYPTHHHPEVGLREAAAPVTADGAPVRQRMGGAVEPLGTMLVGCEVSEPAASVAPAAVGPADGPAMCSHLWDTVTNPLATSTFGLALSWPNEPAATSATTILQLAPDAGDGSAAATAAPPLDAADTSSAVTAAAVGAGRGADDSRPASSIPSLTIPQQVRVCEIAADRRLSLSRRNFSIGRHLYNSSQPKNSIQRASSLLTARLCAVSVASGGAPGSGSGGGGGGNGFHQHPLYSRPPSSVGSLPGSPHSRALVFASSLRNAPTATQLLADGSRRSSLNVQRPPNGPAPGLQEVLPAGGSGAASTAVTATTTAAAVAAAAPPMTGSAFMPAAMEDGPQRTIPNLQNVAIDFLQARRSADVSQPTRMARTSRAAVSSARSLAAAPRSQTDIQEGIPPAAALLKDQQVEGAVSLSHNLPSPPRSTPMLCTVFAAAAAGGISAGTDTGTGCAGGGGDVGAGVGVEGGGAGTGRERAAGGTASRSLRPSLSKIFRTFSSTSSTSSNRRMTSMDAFVPHAAGATRPLQAAGEEVPIGDGLGFASGSVVAPQATRGPASVHVDNGDGGGTSNPPIIVAERSAVMAGATAAAAAAATANRALCTRDVRIEEGRGDCGGGGGGGGRGNCDDTLGAAEAGSAGEAAYESLDRETWEGAQQQQEQRSPEYAATALGLAVSAASGQEECWHEIWAAKAVDPLTGKDVLILSQHDVTAKVIAERHLALVMEAEHRLLEQLFPKHILTHVTEEWIAEAERAAGIRPLFTDMEEAMVTRGCTAGRNGGAMRPVTGAGSSCSSEWRPVVRDCNALATWHREVTLLFADIKGFTPMCKQVTPREVMTMLNDLFSRFDAMLDRFGVFKVETIGDCYFVAGGLIREDEDGMAAVRDEDSRGDPLHAHKVFMFAKAMLSAAREVHMPSTGEPVQIRIGISSGPVVSGVVGTRMPRFCVFGDTVNTTSRMESTGQPGAIHASESAYQLLKSEAWEPTGGIEVKGKGLMQTYLWRPILAAPSTTAPQLSDSSASAAAAAAAAIKLFGGAGAGALLPYADGVQESASDSSVATAAATDATAAAAAGIDDNATAAAASAAATTIGIEVSVLTTAAAGAQGKPTAAADLNSGGDDSDPLISMLLSHAD